MYKNIIEWDESRHGVSVDEFDEHHKKLISLINKLYHAMRNRTAKEEIESVLDSLIEYTEYHFSAEEDTLKILGCPQYDEQVDAHKALLDKVYSLKKDYENGKILITLETMDFLKHWVEDHIMGLDTKYSTCVCSKIKK